MSRSLRRGALAASAIAFSLASLAACSAGNDAQTLEVKPDNAAVKVGDIKIQNATVLTQPKADAPGPAVITGTIFNNGDKAQTLDAIKLASGAVVKLTPGKGQGGLTVPAHGSLLLGGKDNASAVIENGKEAAKNGDAQPVTFQLSKAGDVTLRAFVVPATSFFEGYGPSELPKPPAATPGAPGATSTTAPGTPDAGKTSGGKPAGKPGTPSNNPSKGAKPSGTTSPGTGH
ncbi:DUF461 domain-containing protein [Streptomyces sp. NPDC059070]|uniref:DUF461 domain-containing protein n=1 Tax=unclassified Streptomyces TaxID=2593676 RepID=UPI0034E19A5E